MGPIILRKGAGRKIEPEKANYSVRKGKGLAQRKTYISFGIRARRILAPKKAVRNGVLNILVGPCDAQKP